MFNDERERMLLEDSQYTESIQAWAQSLEIRERRTFWSHLLLTVGKQLIRFGSALTRRFGSPSDMPQPFHHDRAYN